MNTYADDAAFWSGFPDRLQAARRATGLNRVELARTSKVGYTLIWDYETGRKRPRVPVLLKLCRALGISAASLFPPAACWHASRERTPDALGKKNAEENAGTARPVSAPPKEKP